MHLTINKTGTEVLFEDLPKGAVFLLNDRLFVKTVETKYSNCQEINSVDSLDVSEKTVCLPVKEMTVTV